MIELFAHPFSSYCQKAEIAFYENAIPYELRHLEHDGVMDELARLWPFRQFPVLREGDRVVPEATSIIDYLAVRHPGPVALIPADPDAAVEVRLWDRFFDNYVMTPQGDIVFNAIRQPADRDPIGDDKARAMLDTAYAYLDARMETREWVASDFSLADCAARRRYSMPTGRIRSGIVSPTSPPTASACSRDRVWRAQWMKRGHIGIISR